LPGHLRQRQIRAAMRTKYRGNAHWLGAKWAVPHAASRHNHSHGLPRPKYIKTGHRSEGSDDPATIQKPLPEKLEGTFWSLLFGRTRRPVHRLTDEIVGQPGAANCEYSLQNPVTRRTDDSRRQPRRCRQNTKAPVSRKARLSSVGKPFAMVVRRFELPKLPLNSVLCMTSAMGQSRRWSRRRRCPLYPRKRTCA
jgi:hypothetical protein